MCPVSLLIGESIVIWALFKVKQIMRLYLPANLSAFRANVQITIYSLLGERLCFSRRAHAE